MKEKRAKANRLGYYSNHADTFDGMEIIFNSDPRWPPTGFWDGPYPTFDAAKAAAIEYYKMYVETAKYALQHARKLKQVKGTQ